MIPALAAALFVVPMLATAAGAEETELWYRSAERKNLAETLRARGYRCPEVQAGYRIGWRSDGNHVRVVCGRKGGESDEATTFRLVAHASGVARLEPWNEVVLAGYGLRPSLK